MESRSLPFENLSGEIKDAIEAANASHKPIFITEHGLAKAVLIAGQTYEARNSNQEDERERLFRLEEAYLSLLLAMASAMDSHESYLAGHTERVAMLACAIGEELGMFSERLNELRLAALLHDIGEVVIPNDILHRTGKLSAEEFEIIRRHPQVGAEMVAAVERLKHIAEIVHSHQEHFDGSGYPRQLKGEDIPLEARIIAVADAYDAITNLRLHRDSGNHLQALAELQRCRGTSFDPHVVDAFNRIF
jgi:putative nucleotidyltransferase with HDIG domain